MQIQNLQLLIIIFNQNISMFQNSGFEDNQMIDQDSNQRSLPDEVHNEKPLLFWKIIQKPSRGRSYKRKEYFCKMCNSTFDRKFNAIRHEMKKSHHKKFQQQEDIKNVIQAPLNSQIPRLTSQIWTPDRKNIQELVHSIIYPFVSSGLKLKDYYSLSKQILTPIKQAIIQSLTLSLASSLEGLFQQNQNATIQINQLKKSIMQLIGGIDFRKSIIDFSTKIREVHTKIQSKIDKTTRTYQNNKSAFEKFCCMRQITFRNRIMFEEFTLSLNRFQQKNCKRYWGLLKKCDHYFTDFPEMHLYSEAIIKRARIIPKSFEQITSILKKLFVSQPKIVADIWIIISTGFRRSDYHKLKFWTQNGEYVKFIKLIQNKNKNQTSRFIPKSAIRLARYADIQFPLSKQRIKNAVAKCLELFKTCYGFRHRVITNTISALMCSANFLQFHRSALTTLKYYLQAQDQLILDKMINHGLNFSLSAAQQEKIQRRNLTLDATKFPSVEFVKLSTTENQIMLDFDSSAEERALSSIADSPSVVQSQLKQYQQHAGQIAFIAQESQQNVGDEPGFSSMQQCIGSVVSLQHFEQIQNFVNQEAIKQEKQSTSLYIQGLANSTDLRTTFVKFNKHNLDPQDKFTFNSKIVGTEKIIISEVQTQKNSLYHIINDTKTNSLVYSKKLRSQKKSQQDFLIIYKKQPLCLECKNQGQIKLLQVKQNAIYCNCCGYSYEYSNIKKRHSDIQVKFLPGQKFFNRNVYVAKKIKTKNNIRQVLGQRFSLRPKFSQTIPSVMKCNFHDFSCIQEEIKKYRQTIDYQPLTIAKSTIENAGKGLFCTTFLRLGTIVGLYTGQIAHSFQIDENSDSLFEIGWYQFENIYYLIVCDGNSLNQGSRYLNAKPSKECNIQSFLGIFQNEPIVLFIAKRDIEANQQLFFDYGKNFPIPKYK